MFVRVFRQSHLFQSIDLMYYPLFLSTLESHSIYKLNYVQPCH